MADVVGGTVVWNLDVDDKKLKAGLDSARSNVNKAAKDIGDSADGIGSRLSGIGDAFKNATAGSQMFAAGLLAVGAAGAGIATFGIRMAANIETMTQGFVTLLGSTDKANEAIAMIKKDAAATPFELPGLIQANQLLTSVTKDAQVSERFLLNIGKALSAMGRGQPELDRIITNLQQIGAVGFASMLDIKQFAFAGIPIFEMLGEVAKKSGKDLGDMIENHEITFELLQKLFNDAGEGAGKFATAFTTQAGTFNQLMSNFKDNIGIAASEIVKQTGVFDAVKNAFAGMIGFIGSNTPMIVATLKTIFQGVADNGPILIGIIIGGLVPAFTALAISIGAAMVPLLPFIAAGALLGLGIKLIVDSMGGWEVANQQLIAAFTAIGNAFNAYVKPALNVLWTQISTQLMPALQEFWTLVGPILGPVLKVLAQIVVGVVIVAIRLLIEIVIQMINYWTTFTRVATGVVSTFINMVNGIGSVMSGVYRAITQPFIDAWNTISVYANRIRDAMNNINPFVRHSPSLVDNVTRGIDIIKSQIGSLANISIPPISATAAEGLYNPSVLNTGTPATDNTSGGGNGVTVNISEANIKNTQDIEALGREFGFRMALVK